MSNTIPEDRGILRALDDIFTNTSDKSEEHDRPDRRQRGAVQTAVSLSTAELDEADREFLVARSNREDEDSTIAAYRNAYTNKRIVESTIDSVQEDGTSAYWAIFDGPVEVRIYFKDTYLEPVAELMSEQMTPDLIRRQVQFLTKSLGAKIQFVLTSFEQQKDEKTNRSFYLCKASRVIALRRIAGRYFGRDAIRPVKVGDVVNANIISIGNHAGYINVRGVDTRMPISKMSFRYMETMADCCRVGDTIKVKIQDIKIGSDKRVVLDVDARPCEMEKYKLNLPRIKIGGRYRATVVTIRTMRSGEGPKVIASLFINGVDVPAFSSDWRMGIYEKLHSGDEVTVQANGITQDGYVHCTIIETR